ncbi:MAG: hypothetical protein ACOYI8_00075 [Christensenellales bacterium]
MKRIASMVLVTLLVFSQLALAEEEGKDFWGQAGDWIAGAASDVSDWTKDTATNAWDRTKGAAADTWDWTKDTAADAWDWTKGAAVDAWDWTKGAAVYTWDWTAGMATGAWNGITGFFDPPSSIGNPTIPPEPELPEGTQMMYLGYEVTNTGLDNGYSGEREIGRDDPHFGLTLGKFYVSGFTSAVSDADNNFVFLKTVGDNVELHFKLVQDIDMLGGDTFVTIHSDDGGYDKAFEISPTYFGRGTLIVRHTDYRNHVGDPKIYTDYLAAKMSGEADTVIAINEEGDYEVALDYEIKQNYYVFGTKITNTKYNDYRIAFRFSVQNGNCMVFPFDAVTGEELGNVASTQNGFKLDLAYSRYLDIIVKRSVLVERANGYTEDIRFNRPARDGEEYTQEGIYTISVGNRYTGEQTSKTIYVGTDERYILYASQGLSVEQIMRILNAE